MTETATTSATYDQIAGEYAARPGLGDTMDATRRRFAARLAPGARVLDVGCGPGHDTAALRALGLRVVGLDRSRGMLAQARQRGALPLMLGDMRHLPAPDAMLDGIWACASFLHIPMRDAPAVLREFHRALRPGGVLYIGVKRGDGERWVEHESGRRRFFMFYREDQLDALLRSTGFAIREGWASVDSRGRPEDWIGRLAETAGD